MNSSPTFFVIGAQKAGTTTLHDWLSASAQVVLPEIKETHFFSDKNRYELGFEWYKKQFLFRGKRNNCVLGEVDPDYLFFSEAALRMREFIEKPKLIIVFREPLQRAYSHYLMSCRRGYEKLSFEQALLAEEQRCACEDRFHLDHHSYLSRGLYSEQLLRIKKIFSMSEMLFLKFEDFFKQPHVEFNRLCSFIGVSFEPGEVELTKKLNQAALPRFVFLRDFIYGTSKLKKSFGKLFFSNDLKLKFALWLDQMNTVSDSKAKNPDWDNKVPVSFHEQISRECRELANLTGLNLDDWVAYHQASISKKALV